MVEELLESGNISFDDIYDFKIPVKGLISESQMMVVNIKEVIIQNKKIQNIDFGVNKNENAPNLIGMNLLSRLDKIIIDFKKSILTIPN